MIDARKPKLLCKQCRAPALASYFLLGATNTVILGSNSRIFASMRTCRKHQEPNCVSCAAERAAKRSARWRSDEYRERNRERMRNDDRNRERMREHWRTPEGQAYKHKRRSTSEVYKANGAASGVMRRARQRNALPPVADRQGINRAWRELSRKAKRLRMTIDHVIPIAGCRVCGKRGKHVQSNWAMLPHSLNSAKGNRCMSCWMLDLGRPCVFWLPDQDQTNRPGFVVRQELVD